MAEAETKTKEDEDVGGDEKESIAKQMSGQVCSCKRTSDRQPTLYSPIPDQPDTLFQWQRCQVPCYKSMNCKKKKIILKL